MRGGMTRLLSDRSQSASEGCPQSGDPGPAPRNSIPPQCRRSQTQYPQRSDKIGRGFQFSDFGMSFIDARRTDRTSKVALSVNSNGNSGVRP
jgi:hypothetical protein